MKLEEGHMKNGFEEALRSAIKKLILFLSLLASTVASQAAADPIGKLKIFRNANGQFDNYDINPSPENKAAILSLYDGLEVYAGPYSFDPNLSWYQNGFFYQDLEAIYVGGNVADAHPEWIIKDANGNNLYINWGCVNGTCPAYMADLGNPDFRAYWINQARQTMAIGYTAIFVDDASMTMRASNGNGNPATMIDPRTGDAVTLTVWQQWNLTFFQEIRAAFPAPTYRIMQNVTWFADTDQATPNPLIDQQIKLLDYFYLEFGINDPGITGGTGQFSMQKELDMLLRIKADGANFGLAGAPADEPGKELAFAFAMLATDGNDFLGDDTQYPSNPVTWYHGTNLGAPLSSYYITNQGVYERDFQYGTVIVNPPGAAQVQVSMPGFRDMQDNQNTFTLGPKVGKVLFGTPSCNPLTFQGGAVPTTPVARGGSYSLTCNYGAVVDTILAYSGGNAFSIGNRCIYQSFFGTTARFTCQVPATSRRTLTNSCSLVAGGNLNTCPLTNPLPTVVVTAPASGDFNADGKSDIAWRDSGGNVAIWEMNGTQILNPGATFVGNVPNPPWTIVGTGDFNGDGYADMLWRDSSGDLGIWLMNSTQVLNPTSTFVAAVPGWSVAGVGDFNGDGTSDLLWTDGNGNYAIWEMNGTQVLNLAATFVAHVTTTWSVVGTGDFNGDGNSDILWKDDKGDYAIWEMNGTQILTSPTTPVATVATPWSIIRVGDFNGDGTSDLLWADGNGNYAIWEMNGTQILNPTTTFVAFVPTTWSVIGAGDYNGDGKSDLLWTDRNGNYAIWEMNGTQVVNPSATFVGSVSGTWMVQLPLLE
jgi:FG-GAP-like repeat